MSNEIYKAFIKNIPISINRNVPKEIAIIVKRFEIRRNHPYTLNSPLIGVYPFVFTSEDRLRLFSLFGYDENIVKKCISNISSIPSEFKVVSDPFNLFLVWILYNVFICKSLTKSLKNQTLMQFGLYFSYKLFGSLITHYFPHKADEEYMTMVIEDISMKFDIKQYGTWKKIIEKRIEDLILSSKSIHNSILTNFNNDQKILYFVSDFQTRIRNQVKQISNVYYDYVEKNRKIESTQLTITVDQKKIINEPENTYGLAIYVILNHIKFGNIDHKLLLLVNSLFKTLNKTLVTRTLNMIHIAYLNQVKNDYLNKVKPIKDPDNPNYTELYIGLDVFIQNLVIATFRVLIERKVNFSNKISILNELIRIYTASHVADSGIINVKETVKYFIMEQSIVRREVTISSLIPCVIIYLFLYGLESI